jgi:predicted RecB family nuclease
MFGGIEMDTTTQNNNGFNDFVSASDLPQFDQKLLDEYYYVKLQLVKWEKQEEQLKENIKRLMFDRHIKNINSPNMFLSCHKSERVSYPKNKVEEYVPEEILSKIRTVSELLILQAKLK